MSLQADTDRLLDLLTRYLARFVVVTPVQIDAVALWILHTYVYDVADTTPYLIITSAEKGSGKTRLLEVIGSVCSKPDTLAAVTEATLFRIVSDEKPTMLLDEVDTIFKETKGGASEKQEGLRAILNAGYRKGTRVPRCAPSGEIIRFEVYGPKAFAAIGHLPETIEHRGLRIRMVRRAAADPVERFRLKTAREIGGTLKGEIMKWMEAARIHLAYVEPDMPEELDDRAQDAYEILVGIADLGGPEWGERGRSALIELRGEDAISRESMGLRLLRDCHLFREKLERLKHIQTADLLSLLYSDGEEPWEDWWRESTSKKAAMGLSRLMREFGVKPMQFREGEGKFRGYAVEPILALLERYIGEKVGTSVQTGPAQGLPDSEGRYSEEARTDLFSDNHAGCTDPTDLIPPQSTLDLGTASLEELREHFEDTP